jgi:hypothetical protein
MNEGILLGENGQNKMEFQIGEQRELGENWRTVKIVCRDIFSRVKFIYSSRQN